METERWEEKIRFFSKFLGFEEDPEMEETLDQTNKTQIIKKPVRGIKLMSESFLNYSAIQKQSESHRLERRWAELMRHTYKKSSKKEVLGLTSKGTYIPKKVLPWLTDNQQKVTIRLFNMRRAQLRAMHKIPNPHILEEKPVSISILRNKISHPSLFEIAGCLLLTRSDILVGDLLLNINQAVFYYLSDSPIQALEVLSFLTTRGAYLPFLTQDHALMQASIGKICDNIQYNCTSASFLTRDALPLETIVTQWIYTFWLTICDEGSPLQEKIIYFLIINKVSLESLGRVCEATVVGLSRMINQGNRDKSLYTLSNPKIFLDQDVFLNYLFTQK